MYHQHKIDNYLHHFKQTSAIIFSFYTLDWPRSHIFARAQHSTTQSKKGHSKN